MTPDDHCALFALFAETRDTWLPPAGADDDPGAYWREVTLERFRTYRRARDAMLVERFRALLENEWLGLERDMLATAPRDPDDAMH